MKNEKDLKKIGVMQAIMSNSEVSGWIHINDGIVLFASCSNKESGIESKKVLIGLWGYSL